MRTWAFVQQKGGCGKSTVATNLTVHAEERGETVLLIDLDPQANALLWGDKRGTKKPMVMDALPDKLPEVVQAAATLGVTLAVIDTPAKLDATALAAIRVADMIICPTMPDLFNLHSLADTVRLLEMAEKLHAAVAIINGVDGKNAAALIGEASAVLESFNLTIAPAAIRYRTPFATAIKRGKGVTETVPKGPAAKEICELWTWLDQQAKRIGSPAAKDRAKAKERGTA